VMDVVQVSFHLDRLGRSPEQLLSAWPAMPAAAIAAARAGVEIAVVQPAADETTFLRDGVAFHFVRERPGLRRGTPGTRPVSRSASALARAVERLRPRLLHVQGLSLPGHARNLKNRLPGVRLLAQDHADGLPRPWRRARAKRDMESLDAVAFTAAALARPFFESGLFRADLPVHEVLESSVSPPSECIRQRQPGRRFVWLGRLDANKDPLTVLAGFAAVADRLPDARLAMCYMDAPLLTAVRDRIHGDPVLRERVELLGPIPHADVWQLLCESDFLLQGSHREGSGFAVLEAMACGVTPIVTAIPSFRRIVGEAGFLWPPGDVGALASSLLGAAMTDRARLERRVRSRFEAHLSWDVVGQRLAAAYASTLDAAPIVGQALEAVP